MASNKELQANHKMVRFLEEAKAQSEMVLDALPGIFAVVDRHGVIYRGNCRIADLLEVEFEALGSNNIDKLIPAADWKIFLAKLNESKSHVEMGVSFQIDLVGANNVTYDYIMNIRPIANPDYKSTQLDLYVVTGSDVTEVKRVTEKMSRMEVELQTAKAVQDTLFPEPAQFTSSQISLAGSYQPATECGGDWWFYNTIGNRIFLWIGDVTGHGVSAALVTSAARAAVSGIESNPNTTPASALQILNKTVFDASNGQKYMSFCVVAIDLKTGACTYASAGHELPIWLRRLEKDDPKVYEISILPTTYSSYLLGQQENSTFIEETIYLKPGDGLFLYTDGITELHNHNGEQWGERKVKQAILSCARTSANAANFVYKFNEILQLHRGNVEIQDDMTFFVFKLNNYDQAPPKLKTRQTIMGSL